MCLRVHVDSMGLSVWGQNLPHPPPSIYSYCSRLASYYACVAIAIAIYICEKEWEVHALVGGMGQHG